MIYVVILRIANFVLSEKPTMSPFSSTCLIASRVPLRSFSKSLYLGPSQHYYTCIHSTVLPCVLITFLTCFDHVDRKCRKCVNHCCSVKLQLISDKAGRQSQNPRHSRLSLKLNKIPKLYKHLNYLVDCRNNSIYRPEARFSKVPITFRARKVTGTFEKRAPGHLFHLGDQGRALIGDKAFIFLT